MLVAGCLISRQQIAIPSGKKDSHELVGSRGLPRGTLRARHMSAIIPRHHPATPPTTAGFSRPSCRPPAHCPEPSPINLTPLGHQIVECDAFLTLILVVCSVFQSVHSFLRYRPNKRPAGSWLGAGWLPYLLQGLYRTGGMYYRVLWYVDSESVLGLRARFAVLAR